MTTILFKWTETTPDPRPFKPALPRLEPIDVQIAVEVPSDKDHLHNSKEVLMWEIGQSQGGQKPKPILTPTGMRYVIDQLENAMRETNNELDVNDFEPDDWSDDTHFELGD